MVEVTVLLRKSWVDLYINQKAKANTAITEIDMVMVLVPFPALNDMTSGPISFSKSLCGKLVKWVHNFGNIVFKD